MLWHQSLIPRTLYSVYPSELAMSALVSYRSGPPPTVTLGDSVPGSLFFLHELTAADGASHSEYGDQYRIVSLLLLTLSLTLTRNSTTAIPFSLLILTTNNHFPGFRWTRKFLSHGSDSQRTPSTFQLGILEQEKKENIRRLTSHCPRFQSAS